MKIDFIILSGGFGTRIQSKSKGIPKSLLPIGNKVFLDYMLDSLGKYEIKRLILSLHHKSEMFLSYIDQHRFPFEIIPIIEPIPMGTGGAIRYVIENTSISDPFFVLNGDTLSDINQSAMKRVFDGSSYDAMVGISYVKNASRYGTVQFYGDRLIQFSEKGSAYSGWINNGHYVLKKDVFNSLSGNFSIEYDVFPKLAEKNRVGVFKVFNDDFIDMGIPEDYEKLCEKYKVLD